MAGTCPCCRQPLPQTGVGWSKETRTVTRDGQAVVLQHQQARIFDVLWRAWPERLSTAALLERAWAHDPEGGPESSNIVSVHLVNIRKALKPLRMRTGGVRGARDTIGLEIGA